VIITGRSLVQVPWFSVSGFGAHIKATAKNVIIQKDAHVQEVPFGQFNHLLVMGGHTFHTAAVAHLLRAGIFISFFEADGEPVGFIRPFGATEDRVVQQAQHAAFGHNYALAIARGSLLSKLLFIEQFEQESGKPLLYEGELEILRNGLSELEYLIKIEEIRRMHRLLSDMYYEIISRIFPPELGFRRRTSRPYQDVINTMMAYGYGMLFGNTCMAVIGSHLDPDHGFLFQGPKGLVYDMMEPFKPLMIDNVIISLTAEGITKDDYECGSSRCILSDDLMRRLTQLFHNSIEQETIDKQVIVLRDALLDRNEFYMVR
jgi:CRISPR-associated endonuclease Cas1